MGASACLILVDVLLACLICNIAPLTSYEHAKDSNQKLTGSMVNIGGRSKGCSSCRRRRVKCGKLDSSGHHQRTADFQVDENRPVCLQCQRNNLECDGPKDTTFHEAKIVLSRRKVYQRRGSPSAAGPSAASTFPSSSSTLVRPSAPLAGNPQELYIMFTRKHIAPDGPVDVALQELQASDMAQLVPLRTVDCRKTHLQTVLSFATIFFGTKNGFSDVTKQGFISHGATLHQLNKALSDPTCYMYDEVVVSVTTLAMQEMLVPSGPKGYLGHMLGLEKLLTLRGTTSECSQRTVGLYKCLRHMMLYASLVAGRPSILAKPEWKALLRRHCDNEEEIQEQGLYDALADCSVLVAELSELLKSWDAHEEGREDQVAKTRLEAQLLCGQLKAWRAFRDANPAHTYMDATPSWASLQSMNTLWTNEPTSIPTDLVYSNTHAALMLILYNTATLYVLHILITLPLDPQSQQSLHEYMDMVYLTVLEICRSMPDSSDQKLHADMHASPVVHWAVQVAHMILQNDLSAKGRWLVEFLNRKAAATVAKDLTPT